MAEDTDTSLLREIDEELRQEHYSKLWARYGKFIIGAAIVLVAGVAGYKGWQTYDRSLRSSLAEQFSQAVTAELNGDLTQANQAYNALIADSSGGYKTLARFRAASTLSQQNDRAGAATAYTALANDTGIDRPYRDMATLLAAMNEMNTADPESIVSRLAPLTADNNPWRYTARELSALAALRNGNEEQARDLLNLLISDSTTPVSMQSRAQEILAAIGAS